MAPPYRYVARMLTYADVCRRMLTYADVCPPTDPSDDGFFEERAAEEAGSCNSAHSCNSAKLQTYLLDAEEDRCALS
jgi:hypothetical protein